MSATELGVKGVHVVGQDVILGVDLQASAIRATSVSIGSVSIRNTSANFVATKQVWSAYRRMAFRVTSTLNQPVTLTLQVQGTVDMKDITGTVISVVIPANTAEIIVTSKEFPIFDLPKPDEFAIKAVASTAPTTGTLTIIAITEPYI